MVDAPRPEHSQASPPQEHSIERLLALLELADQGSADLDAKVWLAIGGVSFEAQRTWDAPVPLDEYALLSVAAAWERQYTRNLEAAARIVPKDRKGGWFWRVGHGSFEAGWAHLNRYHPDNCNPEDEISASAKTPPLALVIAALKARSAK